MFNLINLRLESSSGDFVNYSIKGKNFQDLIDNLDAKSLDELEGRVFLGYQDSNQRFQGIRIVLPVEESAFKDFLELHKKARAV